MIELIKCVYKTKNRKYKSIKNMIKGLKIYVYIYIIDAGSNNKTVPKMIGLALRYDEAPVAP